MRGMRIAYKLIRNWKYQTAALKSRWIRKTEKLAVFDTSLSSGNMGDMIICDFCDKIMDETLGEFSALRVPTHVLPDAHLVRELPKYKNKIIYGTNLLTSHFESFTNWKIPEDLYGYQDVVALGVGWCYYSDDISETSREIYRRVLSKKQIHSVRDRYTEQKFRQMGFDNVVFTGCATLWELTPEKCAMIPQTKASRVIATITDYSRDEEADRFMLELLFKHYEEVFVWIQGTKDMEYLSSIMDVTKLNLVERSLDAYRDVLQQGDIDYVGTRLHAGIYALNQNVRSIIIAVDNRATEMGKDVNLPVIQRKQIFQELEGMLESRIVTQLDIPWDNISLWKNQFR